MLLSLLFACGVGNQNQELSASSSVTKSFVGRQTESEDTSSDNPVQEPLETEPISSEESLLCDGGYVSLEGMRVMQSLADAQSDDDMYDTYSRIVGVAELFEDCHDSWGLFPTIYKHITAKGIEAIEDGAFEDPVWAEALIVDFAARYFDSLNAVLTRSEASWAWERYYELADRSDVSQTRSVMMAMSAHLVLDLPKSLVAIGTTEDHKDDFILFGDAVIEVSDDLITDLKRHYNTDAEDILNGFFLGNWVDGAFGSDTMITLSFQTIRTKAWNNRWYMQTGMGWVADAEIYTSFWTIDAVLRTLDGAGIID